jgi:hypothetical protein
MGDVYFGDTAFVSGYADFKGASFYGDVRFGGVAVAPIGVDLAGAKR